MPTFLHLGNRIISAEHVIQIERVKAKADKVKTAYGENYVEKGHPAGVKVTLSALELEALDSYGEDSTGRAAAGVSQTVVVYGDLGEHLWTWFENRADIVNLETANA